MYEERPWLKNYATGIPANINPDEYSGIVDMVGQCCKKYKKLPAFTCMGSTISYKDLDRMSDTFGSYLQSRGLEQDDRIAIMMPNLLQYPIALMGAMKAGLVVVNTNPLYTPREMLHQFSCSGVKAIIIAENFAANLEKIIDKTEIKTVVLTSIGEMLGMIKGRLVNFAVRKIKRMVPAFKLENTVSFKEALGQGKKFKLKTFEDKPERVVSHQYTGGTTGVAKGAMLTNRNLVANMLQIRYIMQTRLKELEEVALCPLPMYHSFAFTVNCLAMMSFGAHSILIVNPRDLKTIVAAFKKYPISLTTGVNTLYNAMVHFKAFRALDFSSLKVCVAGGMALQQSVADEWKDLTGCPIAEGYGLTETSPVASVNQLDGSGLDGSIGLPVPSTTFKIVKEDGTDAAINEAGEIWIKGPQVMAGYYQREDETAQILQDGWLKTGDVGLMEESGYFRIVDRKKDMINVSGFNVYPNEIEEVLAAHPKIMEIAAIGVPHERSGETVKVFIVKKDKSLTEEEVINYSHQNLTNYKVPKFVVFKESLPKTNVGKILRRALKDE
jgi:long-chain acyl-CoA synthetase